MRSKALIHVLSRAKGCEFESQFHTEKSEITVLEQKINTVGSTIIF